MKILLAGGAGYIGSRLAPALLEQGYEVEVIDLFWFGDHLPKAVKKIKKDLFNCVKEDFIGYDHVIFLAGLSNDPMAEYSPAKNFIYNGALPSFLAYKANIAGVKRFIYASSCSVYGHAAEKLFTEDDPVTSDYPYGISKLQGERGVLQMHRNDFSVIALRQGTVCGPSPRMRMDLIINTMFKTAMTTGKITVNNPAIWRPIYDIRDSIHGFIKSIEADEVISGVFNVCSGNFTVGQAAESVKARVENLTGKKIDIETKNIEDFRNYRVCTAKAQEVLGFRPKNSIESIVDSLYEQRNNFKDWEKDEYYNIRVFKKLEKATNS